VINPVIMTSHSCVDPWDSIPSVARPVIVGFDLLDFEFRHRAN